MTVPTVSVIVLTFNSAAFVERCLRSLQRQTLADFEVLIVDAGSTDRTREIVGRFDGRFRWLELPRSDMGAARNFGMKHSRGRFITFLDSDDFYLSSKLERQVDGLENQPAADLIFCTALAFRTGRADRVGHKRDTFLPRTLADFVGGRNHNLGTMCMRRSVWDAGFTFGEGDRGRYGEEWRLQLAMARAGLRFALQADALVVVEIRPDSHTLWSRQWIMKSQAVGELERCAALLTPEQARDVDISGAIDSMRAKLVVALILDGRNSEAKRVAHLIHSGQRARRARRLAWIAGLLPKKALAGALRQLWIFWQNRSFDWQPMSAGLRREIAALEERREI